MLADISVNKACLEPFGVLVSMPAPRYEYRSRILCVRIFRLDRLRFVKLPNRVFVPTKTDINAGKNFVCILAVCKSRNSANFSSWSVCIAAGRFMAALFPYTICATR